MQTRENLIRREIVEVLQSLPEFCFSRLLTTGQPIILKRGSVGYYPTHPDRDVERLNSKHTAAQIEAMQVGSHFGFDCPGADPANYEQSDSSHYDAKLRQMWLCKSADERTEDILAVARAERECV